MVGSVKRTDLENASKSKSLSYNTICQSGIISEGVFCRLF